MTTNRNAEIFTALSKAQSAFPVIPKDKTVEVTMKSGGKYKFAYAPLDTIISSVRQPLADNGLSFVQTICDEKVVTILSHSSGVALRLAPTKIICGESGPQAYGSALTYARRYSLTLSLGIVADEDDDANGAAGNATKGKESDRKPAQEQKKQPPPDKQKTELSPDQEKYFPQIRETLTALFGDDRDKKIEGVKFFTAFTTAEGKEIPGVEDYRKLDGKRLQVLAHKLEAVLKKQEKGASE